MIVSVWGNNGCGSSTLALKLALAITELNKNVILVDANFIAPQTKIWFPKINARPEDSMSVILANNIEMDNVAGKITMVNDYLGVLGYGKELSINAIPSRDDTPSELLSVLNNLADIVIIDCQSNITQDVMSFMALDIAEAKIVNLSPDIRGLSWYNSNVLMLKDKWISQKSLILTALNKVKYNSPADSIEKAIGTVEYYLPYVDEIEEEFYAGKINTKYHKGVGKKYGIVIKNMAETIIDFMEHSQNKGVVITKKPVIEEVTEEVVEEIKETPIKEEIPRNENRKQTNEISSPSNKKANRNYEDDNYDYSSTKKPTYNYKNEDEEDDDYSSYTSPYARHKETPKNSFESGVEDDEPESFVPSKPKREPNFSEDEFIPTKKGR